MKLYDLVQTRKGKETVVMTDSLPKVNARMKALRLSHKKGCGGDKVTYVVHPAEDNIKYHKPPVFAFDPSGDAPKAKIRRQKAKRIKNKAKKAIEKKQGDCY